jgi:CheY-like chemotaxis protein
MKKILVIDDEPDILLLMKAGLSQKGYSVKVSSSCNEGLDIFYEFQPDLVLMDINVGSEDGREMCRAIKTQAVYEHIPVILFSANNEALRSYKEYGATAALDKPFNLPALLEVVQQYL